ncbi:MAG: phosphatidate cytidylyltransferase [Pseudomonadota bacterium]|nr:phosphatidate cytidylyltransferase [Pseudomonadota bacterium]
MSERIRTALLAGLLFAVILFFAPRILWVTVVLAGFAGCVSEWIKLCGYAGWRLLSITLTATIFALILFFFIGNVEFVKWRWLIYSDLVFWIVLAPFWLVKPIMFRGWFLALLGIFLFIPFALSLILLRDISPVRLLRYMAVLWVSDSFAYFSGRAVGYHKLAPAISPGKTWEGVAGGMFAVGLYAIIVNWPLSGFFQTCGMLAMAVIGIIGDLFESKIKRYANVKDSGNLLPGHGGLLDRLDSQIAALPLALLLIR